MNSKVRLILIRYFDSVFAPKDCWAQEADDEKLAADHVEAMGQ